MEQTYSNGAAMIDCLEDKFGDKSPQYYFKEDKLADFEIKKEKSKFKFFETIPVISYFLIISSHMVFKTNTKKVTHHPGSACIKVVLLIVFYVLYLKIIQLIFTF